MGRHLKEYDVGSCWPRQCGEKRKDPGGFEDTVWVLTCQSQLGLLSLQVLQSKGQTAMSPGQSEGHSLGEGCQSCGW